MNKVHASVVNYIREASANNSTPVVKLLNGKTDEQIVRLMFQNYRKTAARGLRLTNFGVQVMKSYFQAYEIAAPEAGRALGTSELIYLDRKAKLPYHVSEIGDLVMFDPELGIKLKLADGDVRVLIEMDGDVVALR